MAVKITLDTNCFFDYFQRSPAHIQDLVDLQAQGHIEIAMTTRVMADTLDKWEGQGTSPIWTKIQSFPILETVGSAFRLDTSHVGSEDYLIHDSDAQIIDRLRQIMMKAQVEDVDHLFGHIKASRDIFVTSDSHFLNHQEKLRSEFGAVVLKPADAVRKIQKALSARMRSLFIFGFALVYLLYCSYAWYSRTMYYHEVSLLGITARALAVLLWLLLIWGYTSNRLNRWSWINFFLGALIGGLWMAAIVDRDFILTPMTYGIISGGFASIARTRPAALLQGLLSFLAQFVVDLLLLVTYGPINIEMP